MEKEMISLGLVSPDANRKKNPEPRPTISKSISATSDKRQKSAEIDFEIPRKNSLPVTNSDYQILSQKNSQYDSSSIVIKRITRKGNSVSSFTNEPLLHYRPKIRKYSLGNNPISQNNNNTNLKNRLLNFNSNDSLIKSSMVCGTLSDLSVFGDTALVFTKFCKINSYNFIINIELNHVVHRQAIKQQHLR
jgi:hypothetical protein